jgi:excisionase family DNA binding protein
MHFISLSLVQIFSLHLVGICNLSFCCLHRQKIGAHKGVVTNLTESAAMPLEHSPQRQKRSQRKTQVMERVCVSVNEWCESTGTSKPTTYRMMADGRLRYVQIGKRTRKIPITEYTRLGLPPPEVA